jgi:carboxymethylenebutenolidase
MTMGEYIKIGALDGPGQFSAYVARREGEPRAAIIVIQEIFGVNAGIREKVDSWASKGYLAAAPDMFWRFAPGYDVNPDVPAELEDAMQVRTKFDADNGIKDVEATIRALRGMLPTGGKVGVVGYCMGGRVAYLTATRTDIDASVGYYGAGIDAALNEAHAIARPLMLHFAGEDHFIPPETQQKIGNVLGSNPHVTIHAYPGVDHGFATTSGSRRDDGAAETADARTEAFFASHLA